MSFQSNHFSYVTENSRQKFKYLENQRAFKMKWKAFFIQVNKIIFWKVRVPLLFNFVKIIFSVHFFSKIFSQKILFFYFLSFAKILHSFIQILTFIIECNCNLWWIESSPSETIHNKVLQKTRTARGTPPSEAWFQQICCSTSLLKLHFGVAPSPVDLPYMPQNTPKIEHPGGVVFDAFQHAHY